MSASLGWTLPGIDGCIVTNGCALRHVFHLRQMSCLVLHSGKLVTCALFYMECSCCRVNLMHFNSHQRITHTIILFVLNINSSSFFFFVLTPEFQTLMLSYGPPLFWVCRGSTFSRHMSADRVFFQVFLGLPTGALPTTINLVVHAFT